MRSFFLAILLLSPLTSFATVDAFTEAWIVIQDFNEEEKFFVRKVPVIGCYGLAQGPQLTQFTAEYKVASSIGCGVVSEYAENINALSCATLVDSVESDDFMSFKKVVLNISSCAAKNNAQFITMVRTAAARNFPQTKKGKIVKNKEVELVLIK